MEFICCDINKYKIILFDKKKTINEASYFDKGTSCSNR